MLQIVDRPFGLGDDDRLKNLCQVSRLMNSKLSLISAFLFLFATFFSGNPVPNAQELDEKQLAKVDRISKLVDKAGSQFKSKDFKGSARSIKTAQSLMKNLAKSGGEAAVTALKKDFTRLKKARNLLEKQGQSFSGLPDLMELAKSEGSESKGSTTNGSESKGSGTKGSDSKSDAELVSFTKQVAPIIIEHCGNCHVNRSLGKYSAATFAELLKGTRKGTGFKAGDVEKSRAYWLAENGKMPPQGKGKKVSPASLKILKTWIEQGATFDGTKKQQKANLMQLVGGHGSGSKGSGSKGSSRR